MTINIPNGRKNGRKIYQRLLLQDPPKFTQLGIFGLKIYHLATLAWSSGVVSACHRGDWSYGSLDRILPGYRVVVFKKR
jgi:hypothetical protein